MEMIRSFIAFDVDDEKIIKNLSEAQLMLLKTGADLKLVKPQNIHVTIRFLGGIPPSMIERVYSEMKRVAFSPFDIEIRGLGAFPNLRRINVIWAGVRKGTDELRNIYYQLEPNLQKLGLRPDSKGFSPHITIARVRTGRKKGELADLIKKFEDCEFGVLRARCLRLKKSILTPQGPIYSTLKEVCR